MANDAIRLYAAGKGIKLWRIAEELGIADCNFSRKLRKELSKEEEQKIIEVIEMLAKGVE